MTLTAEQRGEATEVLHQALTTIREIMVFREREPHELSSEARVMVGYLADAVHNIPDWLNGAGLPHDTMIKEIERAKQMIAEARSIPSHRINLVKRDAPRSSSLMFWRR